MADAPSFSTPGMIDTSSMLIISDARELHPDQLTDKEIVKKIKTDIPNLACILKQAFKKLSQAKDKEIIVAIGNSAAGKSTMLTSMIYGPESLQLKTIVENKKLPDGRIIERKEEVIDWTDQFRE